MRITSIFIYLTAVIGANKVVSAPLASLLLEDAAKSQDSFREGLSRLRRINTQRDGVTADNYEIERYELLRSLRKMDHDFLTPVPKNLPRIKTVREPSAIEDEVPRRIRLSDINNGNVKKPIGGSNSLIDSRLYSAENSLWLSAESSPMYTARTSPVHPADAL